MERNLYLIAVPLADAEKTGAALKIAGTVILHSGFHYRHDPAYPSDGEQRAAWLIGAPSGYGLKEVHDLIGSYYSGESGYGDRDEPGRYDPIVTKVD
jgi:hypothetical protein